MRLRPLTRRDWMTMLWLGFIGYYIASFLDFWGLQYISAATLERILLFTYPTLVVLISAAFYRKAVHSHAILALC